MIRIHLSIGGKDLGCLGDFEEDVVRVGRASGNEVEIDAPSLSRVHLELFRSGEGYAVRDAGSKNGIVVNAERVQSKQVKSGDVIGIDDLTLHLEVDPQVEGKPVDREEAAKLGYPIKQSGQMRGPDPSWAQATRASLRVSPESLKARFLLVQAGAPPEEFERLKREGDERAKAIIANPPKPKAAAPARPAAPPPPSPGPHPGLVVAGVLVALVLAGAVAAFLLTKGS